MKPKADLVLCHPFAGQTRPVDRLLAFGVVAGIVFSLMATAEIHRPGRDQNRQSLARDDHVAPRITRTKATTRLC